MNPEQRNDDDLAQEASTGDEEAFAELFRRHFPHKYDFAMRLARDRDVAGAATQASFFRANQWLRSGEPDVPFNLKSFAILHNDLADRLRRRRPQMLEGEEAFAVADPSRLADPALAAELPDLTRTVWQAARELKTGEYEILDLSVRQRLDDGEIASVMGTRPEAVQSSLARVTGSFEESFSSLLLLQRGKRECLDLDFLIGDDEWSPGLRRRILRHQESCELCQGTRQRYPAATALLGTVTTVPAPAGWQETILSRLLEATRTGAAAAGPAPTAPAAVPPGGLAAAAGGAGIVGWLTGVFSDGRGRGPLLAAAGVGLLVIVLVISGLCATGAFEGGEPEPTPTASPTLTPTATATNTPTPTPTPTVTSTATAIPTGTFVPTETAIPTGTPVPTDTPPPPTAPPPTAPPTVAATVPPAPTTPPSP